MNREQELIAQYLDDTLSKAQATELKDWLRAGDANKQEFVTSLARDEVLRAAVIATETFDSIAKYGSVAADARRMKFGTSAIVRGVIAVSLVALVVWLAIMKANNAPTLTLIKSSGLVSLRSEGRQANRVEIGEAISTGTLLIEGDIARAEFVYEDGSSLSLDGGTELSLVGGKAKRLVLRRGTMLASVSSQPASRPFVVRTSKAEATVRGTSFALNAGDRLTLLNVNQGTVDFRRLSDNRILTVSQNEQVRVGGDVSQAWHAEPTARVPSIWRAETTRHDDVTWLGSWAHDVLMAKPRNVFLKVDGVEETHFQAGARNSFPGLVTLDVDSVVRVRYRIERSLNLGLFISTHSASWDFTGNFRAYVEERNTPADADGWRTATVPIGSFRPMRRTGMEFRPGCIAATIYATTFADHVGLQVAELEVVTASIDQGQ